MEFKKQHIKTSVVACVVDPDDRVLLTRRCIHPFCGQWVMPGGKIDLGEPILKALHREVKEEVGIEIHVEGLIDVFEHVSVGEKNDHFIILYYRTAPMTFDLCPNGEECTEAAWVAKEQLSSFDITPGSRYILSKVFPELDWEKAPPPVLSPDQEVPGGFPLPKT
jgi:8-oxo-dGTP diphosphatase